jgi:2,4-dienoyl-CoA reductase-like NADH-dependent reductase (Old Yellow Enzyme family)
MNNKKESILFSPIKVGELELKNRFVHSGTYEAMSDENGFVTDRLLKRYKTLAGGEIGFIIPGYMSVHPLGRSTLHTTGIHDDKFIPGLKKLANTIHQENGKVCFQLAHCGRQAFKTVVGQTPIAPSSVGRDPMFMVKPRKMTEDEIQVAKNAYIDAAKRAVEAGTDAIHISAGGGYLPNQFLSPYLNQRTDSWGGTDEKRFRFVREIVSGVKEVMPQEMPLVMKLNVRDFTPKDGIVPSLAQKYAKWLVDLKVDGLEFTTGTIAFSNMHMWRGKVPTAGLVRFAPWWQKPLVWLYLKNMEGKFDFEEAWNFEYTKAIKPIMGDIKLFLVGGMRRIEHMEAIVENGEADLISMCRPFIREPALVKHFKEGKSTKSKCVSCNNCVAAIANNMPVKHYEKGLPG